MSAGARVLVCDDDPQILRALRVVLRDAGYDVIPAETGEEALDRMAVRPPEAAIIDLMLPGIDGVEVCRRLREWSQIPVIVLSAVDEESEKVRALRGGADDYVTKPFSPDELLARLEAALRRAGAPADEPVLEVDGLALDLAARRVTLDDEELHLTPIEYSLLRLLMRNRGRLLTHRALLTEVWGPEYADATSVLRTHIANLRGKIEGPAHQRRYIRTDSGVGYRFVA
ncbi:response regulator transcription factor [Baekduia sp.]|jgi:two-component system KDP operon response regulator KdpE|uniref:response regulator transcription factor n=1 Tax=Baekduia sp. TaxID=2600305 RepID=UPI002E0ABE89|nr:response regulator transcription factor [Baekduia sp.]